MKAPELSGQIDEGQQLVATLPEDNEAEAILTADWLSASTASLEEVWDNEEDAVYDHL